MAGATARAALRWKGLADPANANLLSQNLAEDVDAKILLWLTGSIGSRPAASLPGRVYYSTDDDRYALDVGATWRKILAQVASGDYKADNPVDAASFKVAGTALASTHLSDTAALARLASPVFTGNPTAPTPSTGDNDTSVATTAYVQAQIASILGASPSLGGNPVSVTPAADDSDTSIATTGFVQGQLASAAPAAIGTAAAVGTSPKHARGDHVHSFPAYASYTPTFISNGNPLTLGVGAVKKGSYIQVGKHCHYQGSIYCGSSAFDPGDGGFAIGLPVAAKRDASGTPSFGSLGGIAGCWDTASGKGCVGMAQVNNSSVATVFQIIFVDSTLAVRTLNGITTLAASPGGFEIFWNLIYEVN